MLGLGDIHPIPTFREYIHLNSSLQSKVDESSGQAMNLTIYQSAAKSGKAIMSYQPTATTLNDLIQEVRYSNGCIGSCSITGVSPMPTAATWYNFIWLPHRTGGNYGNASGDNHNYGTLLLFYMTADNGTWYSVPYNNTNIRTPKAHS